MGPPAKNFVVYKSSAGSGKTFTLVKEYLEIILRHPDSFRNVLAITFTNKAANEMKERILRYLKALADPVSHPDSVVRDFLLPDLARGTGLEPAEIRHRAGVALSLLMHHYSDFAVSTIDSFYHRVVRTFAYDLNIPMTFEVVLEEEEVLKEVVGLLLDRVGTDKDLTRILLRFVQEKTEDEKSWDIEKDLVDFSSVLTREASIPYLERMARLTSAQIEEAGEVIWQRIRSFETRLSGLASELLKTLMDSGLEEADLAGGSRGLMKWLIKLSAHDFEKLKVPSAVVGALEKGDWHSSKAGPAERARIAALSPGITHQVQTLQQLIEKEKPAYLSLKIIRKYLYPMAVLGAMDRELQNYRQENNILLISEFNRRIHHIVSSQPAPFIYERLGERYRHFMIDEFQDTSVLQWHNVLPLLENSLAEGHMNLVVGDGKQAIYRFRAGDVRQFERLPQLLEPPADTLLKDREGALVRNYELKILKRNFRSSREVVDFNNKLFSRISQWRKEELLPVYSDVVQEMSNHPGGGVRIEFVQAEEEGISYNETVLHKVLQLTDELQEKGFRQKDIAILCRANKNASQIAGMLLAAGKQVVSADSLVLSFSPEVNFLMAWIHYLANPYDEVSRAHILMYLQQRGHFTREATEGFLLDKDVPDRWAPGRERAEYLRRGFNRMMKASFPGYSADELLHLDLFHLTGELERQFIQPHHPDPYLQFFHDQVLELLKKDRQSLPDILRWWEEKGSGLSISTPEGLDAIRVMSIHKSKGLEFPVVIFPYADDTLRATLKNAWVEVTQEPLKEILPVAYVSMTSALEGSDFQEVYAGEMGQSAVDLVNILYVAMTRARDHLFVLSASPPRETEPADSIPRILKRYLQEEGLWQDDVTTYAFGRPGERTFETKTELPLPDSPQPPAGKFTDWKERVLLRRTAPEFWDVEDPEQAFAFGNKVHYILSGIRHAGDIPLAVEKAVMEGVVDPREQEDVRSILQNLVSRSRTAWLFDSSWEVRNEAEILSPEGNIFRPDRLMFRGDEVVVVDYKTGRRADYHLGQVKHYATLLKETGCKVSGVFIVYLGREIDIVDALDTTGSGSGLKQDNDRG